MRLITLFAVLAFGFSLSACSTSSDSPVLISAREGKAMLDADDEVILVDVRTLEEYQEAHIPGAILLPLSDLAVDAASALPDKDAKIILYCRSGNRSAQAATILDGLGYTKVYDMGGIIDWPYETTTA
ncbi:MAG: rhodanese-like domain-containing protein [Bacillota bacterium]|nr:rhodanese-like domain-containing protein [Bacillota bacterium]